MKAWRYYGRRDVRLEDVPMASLKEREVLIKVSACGICQTDIDEFMAGPRLFSPVPLIPGHEFGGVIADVGPKVSKEKIGQVVTVAPLISCGECFFCRIGKENLCERVGYLGILNFNGGFAEYAIVPEENAIEIKEQALVPFGEIVLVALRAFSLAKKFPFDQKRVLITGAGPVGLVVALLFRLYGWEVEICEIRDKRRNFAHSFGFKVYPVIHEVPDQYFSLVIDCAGEDPVIPYIFSDQVNKVTKGGVIILLGLYFSEVSIDALTLVTSEIALIPSFLYTKKEIEILPSIIHSLSDYLIKMVKRVPFEKLIDILIALEIQKDEYLKVVLYHANS